jgi:hypothetical protein
VKAELIVKGGYAVDFGGCEVKVPGHPVEGLRGQIGELFLNPLEHGNQIPAILSEGIKTGVQLPKFFSVEILCHEKPLLLKSDFLHGAVNALDAVAEKETKPLQNAEPQSRVAEHKGPDFGSIEKDRLSRLPAQGGREETVGFAQERGPAPKGSALSYGADLHVAFSRSQIYGSLQSDLAFCDDVNAVSRVTLAKNRLPRLKGLFPAQAGDLFDVHFAEAPEELRALQRLINL